MSIIKTNNFTAEELKSMLCRGDLAISDLDSTALYRLIDHETTRLCFGDGDIEFIEDCSALLAEREKHADVKGVFEKAAEQYLPKPKTRRFFIKRGLIAAAAVATLVISGTVVASALGFSVYDFIARIIMEPDGTELEDSELTFYNAGEHKTYSGLKDAVEKENLNIMYPASLPEGVSVKELRVADSQIGDKRIYVFTENDEIIITVDTGVTSPEGAFDNQEPYTKNGVSYILYESTTEHKYGAYCNADNCDYIIQAKKHEDLIYIIENLVKPQGATSPDNSNYISCTLIVNGKDISDGNYVAMHTENKQAALPLLAILCELGADIQDVSDTVKNVYYQSKTYILDMEGCALTDEDGNNVLLVDGGDYFVYEKDGELIVIDSVLSYVFYDMGINCRITIDRDSSAVVITQNS